MNLPWSRKQALLNRLQELDDFDTWHSALEIGHILSINIDQRVFDITIISLKSLFLGLFLTAISISLDSQNLKVDCLGHSVYMLSSLGTLPDQGSGNTKYLYNPWDDATEETSQETNPSKGLVIP